MFVLAITEADKYVGNVRGRAEQKYDHWNLSTNTQTLNTKEDAKKMVWTEGYKEVGNDSQETFNSEKQFKNKTRNSSSAILSV